MLETSCEITLGRSSQENNSIQLRTLKHFGSISMRPFLVQKNPAQIGNLQRQRNDLGTF